ncbi:hypothetical protein BUALT_Bualt13G0031300 [Buddleja alternifolia]|uniref:Uncharacterized protein n=1 Tax=Buddleja alternifolia TaxID=168488 RepID=A0AAV6WVA2_9LAMI|nr:hypothetical protein BUALT_Bualt13G0031300 [Buddleja alternifolia]
MSPQKENLVLFPFMGQGHIIPFLSLALKLEQQRGFSITFVNTPLNIKRLRNNLPKSSNINLVEIPFDSAKHGLPPNSETTEALPAPLVRRLVESTPALKPAFRTLVAELVAEHGGKNPLCIISDMLFAWSVDVAHEFGIFHAIFNTSGGFGTAGLHTMFLNLPYLESNSDEFWMPGFPTGYMFKTENLPEELRAATKPVKFAVEMFRDWKETDAMLFNTVEEIDHTGLTYFHEQFPNCSVYAVGPIVSAAAGTQARGGGEELEGTIKQCIKWLNSKPEKSVLFVAFGSQSAPSDIQTFELAKALEFSDIEMPFSKKNFRSNGEILCDCGKPATLQTSWEDEHCGRRFHGCNKIEGEENATEGEEN